jgi:outer membrane lipoprotein-sorting protein
MSEINEKEIKRRFEVISQFEPDREVTARDLQQTRKSLAGKISTKQPAELKIWRTIMKSNISKLAAAAVIIIAVFLGLHELVGISGSSSVAWAEVSANIEGAKSMTWRVTVIEEGNSTIYRYMFLGPSILRIEDQDGKVTISDRQQEELLIIDPANKTASVNYVKSKGVNYYNRFTDFLNREGLSVELIGTRQINSKNAIGFNLERPKGNDGYYGVMEDNEPIISYETVFWIDSETKLPILVEKVVVGEKGRTVNYVYDEILFNVELDKSLFNLEVPNGYELQYDSDIYDQMKSATAMNEILKACMIYDNQHGQWPDSLQELGLPDIDVGRYIYLKPHTQPDGSTIVMYEAYTRWENGINVGFGNYRFQYIEDEVEFKNLLER